MTAVERVKEICKEKKIPISRLERELGFSNGYIRTLREGKFPSDRIKLIADYLGVTVNYLITGDDNKENLINAKYATLDDAYLSIAVEAQENGLSTKDIEMIVDIIRAIKKRRGE